MENEKDLKLLSKKTSHPETSFFTDEEGLNNSNYITSTSEKSKQWINKTRILIVASRGISHQESHLVNNLISLIPNSKKECKIENNTAKEELNEICYNHSCKFCLYFEHRKRELILWMFKSPEGPCVKFQVNNIHTLKEIKLMGNCIKYSRPLLSFDSSFNNQSHLKLLKELFFNIFNSPKGHPKIKPFYDHQICFFNLNNQIFFRNYQILNEAKEKFTNDDVENKLNLLEIGPRFSLTLIRIFDGALGGKTLYKNIYYLSPGVIMKRKNENYIKRKLKNEEEKRDLDDKINNIKKEKQRWMKDDE